jgi:hypothetical protein
MWGHSFLVRTDHFALKFPLDQRLSTVPQHQWISKLFGIDFTIEYRPGRLNTVADALLRRDSDGPPADALALALSAPSCSFLDESSTAMTTTDDARRLHQ